MQQLFHILQPVLLHFIQEQEKGGMNIIHNIDSIQVVVAGIVINPLMLATFRTVNQN